MNYNSLSFCLTLELTLIYTTFCHNIDTEFPIVFEPNFDRNNENYFGLSVEMQTIGDQINFLIGAPKTNSTLYDVRQSGTVFRCYLSSNDRTECNEILIDFGRIASSNRRLHNKVDVKPTDGMFLGGTIVGRPESSQTVVCAHRWSQSFYRLSNQLSEITPTGSCYVIDLAKPEDTPIGIFPLTDRNLQFYYQTYYYSHSMTGFSAAFTSRGEHLLLGAPGFYQWRGSFLETNRVDTKSSDLIGEQFLFQKQRFLRDTDTESYTGYATVSGHFLDGIRDSIVVGAPRDRNLKGRVVIFNLNNGLHSEDTTQMVIDIEGMQIGEYFGATLLAIDINNDRFSDLVVGSPLFSTQEMSDCGRVFVYMNNKKGFGSPVILSPSESSGSRFGTSLADLGDINFDGYNDMAIGAPYEDDRGVIYIYLGNKKGVEDKYSQRISASKDLSNLNLRGFGISIVGNKDVDQNFYDDIVVGSYLSNNAVLLRTKPMVTIRPEVVFNASNINVNDQSCRYLEPNTRIQRKTSCVNIRYCLSYDGSHVPSSLIFNVSLQMDSKRPESPRCFAIDNNKIKSHINKVQEINAYKTMFCSEPFVVYLKNKTAIDDIFTPIDFSLSYSIVQLKLRPNFCSNCPIIGNNPKTSSQLHFQTGCRVDQKCISNLKLSTKSLLNGVLVRRGDRLLQGFHKNLTIIASVVNSGEPSYLTKIVIKSNPKLYLLKQDTRCRLPVTPDIDSTYIECDVGNPLRIGSSDELSIPLDISQLESSVDRLDIDVSVTTASEPTKDSQLSESIEIHVMRSASLEIFGSSSVSEIVYESESKRQSDSIPFTGIFQITKKNWSSVDDVLIEIQIPSFFNQQPLIYRPRVSTGVNAHNKEPSLNCNRTTSSIEALPIKSRPKRSTDQHENDSRSKTLKLDCKSPIVCQSMQCFAGPFGTERQTVRFYVESDLNINNIESIFGKKYNSIDLIIRTKASILDKKISSDSVSIATKFTFKRVIIKKEWFELWIIIASFVTGFVLLVAITFVLWKLGFFSRNQYKTNEENNENNELELKIKESGSLLDFDLDSGFDNEVQPNH